MQQSLSRFERQIDVPDIGVKGQEKFMRSSALVVGLGGLGCPAALYLAAAGIGTLGLVDPDRVDVSNLQRQVLYTEQDVGALKVEVAAAALRRHQGACTINAYATRFEPGMVDAYDIVLDCTDNFETRFLLNKACHEARKKLVSAALYHHDGQIAVYKPYMGDGHPCYACAYPSAEAAEGLPSCSQAGIVGPVAGMMGTMQASAAMNELLDIGESLSGWLLMVNALTFNVQKLRIPKKKGCRVCG